MIDIDLSLRQTTLTLLTALLIVTAGCTAGVSGSLLGSNTAEENAETETEEAITPEDGNDLRTISINEQFGEAEGEGELDGADPRQNNKVYEPVEFVGQEGRYYNITMESYFGDEEMRLIDPDGEVVAVETGNSDTPAKFEMVKLNKTGKYTIHATSVEERNTFTYTLSINEVLGAGPRDGWGEYERYSQFGALSDFYWEEQAPSEAEFTGVNTTEDYIVIEYERDEDANYTVQNSDYAFMGRTLIDVRDYIATHPEGLQRDNPEEWYPDRVYFKGYNEEGELVQTNYVDQRWAELFEESGNTKTEEYFYKIVGTTKWGPGSNEYSVSEPNETVEEDQFPYPTYPKEYVAFPTE